MAGIKRYTLGKTERLKSRKQIDFLFGSGKKITLFPFRLIYRAEPGNPGIKSGFTVSSKNFPRAVDRNRIKRLTREAYRYEKPELLPLVKKNQILLHLFFIYTGREILSFAEVSIRLKLVLDKMARVIHEEHHANS